MRNTSDAAISIGSPTTKGRENAGYGGLFWRGPRSFTGGTVVAPGASGAGNEVRGSVTSGWASSAGTTASTHLPGRDRRRPREPAASAPVVRPQRGVRGPLPGAVLQRRTGDHARRDRALPIWRRNRRWGSRPRAQLADAVRARLEQSAPSRSRPDVHRTVLLPRRRLGHTAGRIPRRSDRRHLRRKPARAPRLHRMLVVASPGQARCIRSAPTATERRRWHRVMSSGSLPARSTAP